MKRGENLIFLREVVQEKQVNQKSELFHLQFFSVN